MNFARCSVCAVSVFSALYLSLAHGQNNPSLILECGPKDRPDLYALEISLEDETFNAFSEGSILENFDQPLVEVTPERIVLYESYGGRPMYVDRINSTFSIARYIYPCVRKEPVKKQPKF